MTPPLPRTAAALVIGNELLSGKVSDANVVVLARLLRELGVLLRRVVMVSDDVETIATEMSALSSTHDWLFTSGGVGPTHDDVTLAAAARAFGSPLVVHAEIEAMIRAHYGERVTAGHLSMAIVPSGTVLERSDNTRWPALRHGNTWFLPGIPEAFKMRLAAIRAHLGAGVPFSTFAVFTLADEPEIKPLLDQVVGQFADVEIGSYPKWNEPRYRTKLTFDCLNEGRARAARDAFIALLPPGEPQLVDETPVSAAT